MLHVGTYGREAVEASRAGIASTVAVHRELVDAARAGSPADPRLEAAIAAVEPQLYASLLLALDNMFCHRGRGIEGKDGNPLNEARVLCNSLVMTADSTIRLKAERSLLGYEVGDEIRLDQAGFLRLSEAFLAEIQRKYC